MDRLPVTRSYKVNLPYLFKGSSWIYRICYDTIRLYTATLKHGRLTYVNINSKTYDYRHMQSDLTYPHTSVLNKIAHKVRELDK